MAKLGLSLLAMLLLLASAAAADTLINPGGRCGREIERRRLSSCREYLSDGSRCDDEGRGGGWREAFPQCCEEIEKINSQCRCEALKEVVREHREAGELQGREMREMLQTAQSLPRLCRISSHYCDNIQEIALMF